MRIVLEGFIKKDEIDSNRIDFLMDNKEVFYFETNNESKEFLEIPKILALKGFLKEGEVKIIIEFLEKDNNKKIKEDLVTKKFEKEQKTEENNKDLKFNKEEVERIIKEIKKLKEKFER